MGRERRMDFFGGIEREVRDRYVWSGAIWVGAGNAFLELCFHQASRGQQFLHQGQVGTREVAVVEFFAFFVGVEDRDFNHDADS